MTVVALAAYRQRRADRQAAAARHSCVIGGPHADTLRYVVEVLMPLGYRAGLWRVGRGRSGHALTPTHDGREATRCGLTVAAGDARRADISIGPCRRCFPS